jgi:hypothetical protein
MVFDGCGCRLIKNTNIEEVLVRAMNAYFRQDLNQVYLAMVTMKGEKAFFTIL